MGRDDRRSNPFGNLGASEFARQVGTGMIAPIDRMGNPIRPDMNVLIKTSVDTIFTVVAVTPNLDPRMPNTAKVTLAVQFDIFAPLGRPIQEIIGVGWKDQETAEREIKRMFGGEVAAAAATQAAAPEADNGNLKLRVVPGAPVEDAAAEEQPPAPVDAPPAKDDVEP